MSLQSDSQKYRVTFMHDEPSIESMIRIMRITDTELASRFVRDDDSPDYVIATDKALLRRKMCLRLKNYMAERENAVFIFFTTESPDPDLNVFDYAFTWNPDLFCGDRIIHNLPSIYDEQLRAPLQNTLTRENARKILESSPGFCNFVYSHPSDYRDKFFHLLSRYRHVDSLGSHLHNTDAKTSRDSDDWYSLSINMKSGYKFSIAMENASCPGYTTEKIISSLQAHTVPIYWGDPRITDYINPATFINCNDFGSIEEIIERVKEIDSDNDKWLDMVTQSWQTEGQRNLTFSAAEEYSGRIRHIFTQGITEARRRPKGMWSDICRENFTGASGILPGPGARIMKEAKRVCVQLKDLAERILRLK